ncbi:MAG: PilT/PilU family type 4a pilus ATPase [Myxococcota bacterium]|jgi:twitching motility protein PilT|nr:PilT/PilU family type 4a pilus ATPase [Myxococcota bacterium]
MKQLTLSPEMLNKAAGAIGKSPLFSGLNPQQTQAVVGQAQTLGFAKNDTLIESGSDNKAFFLLMRGEVAIMNGQAEEIARLKPPQSIGEMESLLNQSAKTSVIATEDTVAFKFSPEHFKAMCDKVPGFGLALAKDLAERLHKGNQMIAPSAPNTSNPSASQVEMPEDDDDDESDAADVMRDIDTPDTRLLDDILAKMTEAGSSDLHLAADNPPYWRNSGEMEIMEGYEPLGPEQAFHMFAKVMPNRNIKEFKKINDTDFACAIGPDARFRVNIYRDRKGVAGCLRQIPTGILTLEQLGCPEPVRKMCEEKKGLVLVTGPTGSGKSTTMAAMLDYINKTRAEHILTFEDPIEFVHQNIKCLVNQREIGPHTTSFGRALKAALREDPDIILVGEMRDVETVHLALEAANTGHLVFGTLHTMTAVSTISRIIDLFPAEDQNRIRSAIADGLKGVVAQQLCKKIGGGRVAALELLVPGRAECNLVREAKLFQIPNMMATGAARGNVLLNNALKTLVEDKKITVEEAMDKSPDRPEMAKKLGIEYDEHQ